MSKRDDRKTLIEEHLIELAARNSVLEYILGALHASLFASHPDGAAAMLKLREKVIYAFRYESNAPNDTDSEVALEMQTRAIAFAGQFFDRACALRDEMAAGLHGGS
jgi:hypothetical protein